MATDAKKLKAGSEFSLRDVPLFRDSTYPVSHRSISGKFYLYDGIEENGRYKITLSRKGVRFKPAIMVVEGWVRKSDLSTQGTEGKA